MKKGAIELTIMYVLCVHVHVGLFTSIDRNANSNNQQDLGQTMSNRTNFAGGGFFRGMGIVITPAIFVRCQPNSLQMKQITE
jgi:hypothetical protein